MTIASRLRGCDDGLSSIAARAPIDEASTRDNSTSTRRNNRHAIGHVSVLASACDNLRAVKLLHEASLLVPWRRIRILMTDCKFL